MVSDPKANVFLSHLLTGTPIAAMSELYLGLCSGQPSKANGAISGEPAGMDGYERKRINGDKNYFGSPVQAIIKNAEDIIMYVAKEAQGQMNYWFVSTSKEGGVAIVWGDLKNRNTGAPGLDVGFETVPVFYKDELKLEITADGDAAAST